MKRLIAFLLIFTLFGIGSAFAAITAPSDFAVSSKTNTSFTLSWTIESHYDSLMVYIDGAWIAQIDSAGITYQTTDLTPGTTYSVYAVADSAGVTDNTDTLSVTLYYPMFDGPGYSSVIEALLPVHKANSWPGSLVSTFTLSTASALDSTTVIVPFDDTDIQFDVAGHADSCKVKVYFYGGVCDGPFKVTLRDSLVITTPGRKHKAISWGGPVAHGYAVLVGQTGNGNTTTITNGYWTLRRNGGF